MPSSSSTACSTLVLRQPHHQQQQQHVMKTVTTTTTTERGGQQQLVDDLLEMASKEIENMRKAKARHCKRHRPNPSTTTTSTTVQQTLLQASSIPAPPPPPPPLYHSLPIACMTIIKNMPGNDKCIDCGITRNPNWAAVSYGALLCLQCSGHHRSFGVNVSCVRSLNMDEWSLEHILSMLEGGNEQCLHFFKRHQLTPDSLPTKTTTTTTTKEERGSPSSSSCCSGSSSTGSSNCSSDEDDTKASKFTKQNVTRLRYQTKAALFYRQQMSIHVRKVLQSGPYKGREASRQRHQIQSQSSQSQTH